MYVCHLCKEERPGTGMESPVGKGTVCSFCYEELMKEVEFLQERAATQAEFDAGICRCCGHVFPIEDMFVVCDGGEQYRVCTKCFDKIYFEEEIEMTQELDRFVCDSCGEVSVLPSYDPMFGRGQVCFRCHEANKKIERMMDMDTSANMTVLKEDYDEVEYQHELDRFTAELEEDEMDEKRFHQ